MKTTLRSALASLVALVAVLAAPASAGVVAYTSLAAFNAATVGNVSHNFEGIAPAGGFVPGPVVVDGITFDTTGSGFVIDANAGYGNYGASYFSGQLPGNVVALQGGLTAIGFFYGSYTDASQAGSALLSSGDIFVLSTPALTTDVNFIGFVSDSALLTSVEFNSTASAFDITQFITARALSVNTVPEPGSMLLVGAALLGLGLARRRAAR